MKKSFISMTLLLIILSCSRNEYEKNLIGTWNNFPLDGRTDITFYKDSVVKYEYFIKRIGKWKADSSKIFMRFPTKTPGLKDSRTLYYRISLGKDSLLTKTDTILWDFVLLRVRDSWNHYLKEIGLQIELPKAKFDLIRNDSILNGVDLYVAYQNDSLAIKNDRGYPLDLLNDIKHFIYSERASRKKEDIDKMNYNLIVDKGVSEHKVDSIKNILKVFPKMKIFRVFKNDAANYGKYPVVNGGET